MDRLIRNGTQLINLDLHRQLNLFRRLSLKHQKASCHIHFNSSCLKNNLKPSYVRFNIHNNHQWTKNIERTICKQWIKSEIKHWYFQRDSCFVACRILHSEIANKLHPIEFDQFLTKTLEINKDAISEVKQRHYNKLQTMFRERENNRVRNEPWNNPNFTVREPHKFFKRVLNLSDITIDKDEKQLLSKGFKFGLELPKDVPKKHLINQAIAIEEAVSIKFSNSETLNHIKLQQEIAQSLLKIQKNPNFIGNDVIPTNHITARNIKKKMLDNNVIAIKADKGNTCVLMNQIDYENKITEFLDNDNFKQITSDPTNKIQSSLKKQLKKSTSILVDCQIKNLQVKNPTIPRLYGLPKIHKPNIPIRPIVAFNNAPAYKVSKFLNYFVRKHFTFENNRSVKNTSELVNKIQHSEIRNNSRLISFDVTNLFTNVPVQETIDIVTANLLKSKLTKIQVVETDELLRTVLNNNYFKTNRGIFVQSEGLAMGSGLSPFLAEAFMNNFENKLVLDQNLPFFKDIGFWYRYVDDIICLWNGSEVDLDLFLIFINSLHNNIKFTLEKDSNRTLNFLDLTISIVDNKFEFDIYRKPTHTDTVIHADSNHHMSHKMAAFNSYIHRALTVPLSETSLIKELKIIKMIAKNNGYDENMVDRMVNKKRWRLLNSLAGSGLVRVGVEGWISLEYTGTLSQSLQHILNKFNIRTAYKPVNTLFSILPNPKVKLNKYERPGVYCLECADCSCSYIGKTIRNFNVRFAEHERAHRLNHPEQSHFAKHLISEGHSPNNYDETKILHFEATDSKLTLLEILEIRLANERGVNICNEQTLFPLSPIMTTLVNILK